MYVFTAPLQLNNHNQKHSEIHILKCPERKTNFGYCLKFRKHRCSFWPFGYNVMVWERRTSPWRQQSSHISHTALVWCHFHHPTPSVTGSSFGPVPVHVPACHSHRWAIDLSGRVRRSRLGVVLMKKHNAIDKTLLLSDNFLFHQSLCLQKENEINKPFLSLVIICTGTHKCFNGLERACG